MKKYKILIFLLIFLFVCYTIYSIIISVSTFQSKKIVELPKDHKEFFEMKNTGLIHKLSIAKDSCYPLSVYTYKSKYEIILFKQKISTDRIVDSITFHNRYLNKRIGKAYTSFLGLDELSYSFEYFDQINRVDVFIEGFKDSFIKKKTDKGIYLSFPIDKFFSMTYNGSKRAIVHCRKTLSQEKEYNEFAILVKENYIYFIYLKSFSESQKEKLILKDLIKW